MSTFPFRRLVLVLGDLAVFFAALLGALFLRYGDISAHLPSHLLPFGLLWMIWIVALYITRLYEPEVNQDRIQLFRTYLESMIVNLLLGFAFFYLIPFFGIAPRTNLFMQFALALLLGYGWRIFYNHRIFPKLFRNPVLFIGPARSIQTVQTLLKDRRLGFELAAAIITSTETGDLPTHIEISKLVGDLNRLIQSHHIQTIVLGQRVDEVPGLQDALYANLASSVVLLDRASLEETVTGRVPLEYVNQLWFLEHLHEHEKRWLDLLKRGIDILIAIPFGLITAILTPFVALAIRIVSPGPTFIRQTRIGKLGQPFTLIKFRTMHALSADGSAETGGAQFTKDAKTDPRLFPLGRILRQLRLDELPQIWNVFRGDLSIVGPRPERPEFVKPLEEKMPFYALRHLIRPGLTGWAQVRYLTPVSKLEDNLIKLQYDLYYIRHRSLLLDLAILLRTIGIVLRRQGT